MNNFEEISGNLLPEMNVYNIWMEYAEKLFRELTKELLIKK